MTPDRPGRPEEALGQEGPAPVELADLPPAQREAASRAGWSSLMPVQARAIPVLLAGRDVMVQSRTGSGKTGAFLLPILDRIDARIAACQALILTPTRELARQVADESARLSGPNGPRTVAVYGGVGYGAQLDGFRAGAHIVVGTPGRVLDHLIRGSLSLDRLRFLVFDEADRMLSMGFYPDMKQVQRHLPKRAIQGAMFSATFPPHVLRLAGQFLREPELLSLSADHVHVVETEHQYCVCEGMDKDRTLVRIIEIENPTSAIVFCNTKSRVHYVTVVLQRFGYDADELSADLAQGAREKVLTRVREGKLRFLVATDVAARGIDIPEISHVIQYDVPEDPEGYIHRAGRTGRAGAAGEAISLVAGMEKYDLLRIGKRYGIDLREISPPTDEDVEAIVGQRVTALLEARLRARDKLRVERMQRFVKLGRELAGNEDESALIAMLLDDYYQQSLHAPPSVPGGETPTEIKRPPRQSSSAEASPASGRRRSRSKRR